MTTEPMTTEPMTTEPATTEPATTEPTSEAWPRSARLDAPRVLDRIAEITGVRLLLEGPCPGGEIGARHHSGVRDTPDWSAASGPAG